MMTSERRNLMNGHDLCRCYQMVEASVQMVEEMYVI